MKNKSRLFGLFLPFFALILTVAVTLRTIATINHLDYIYGYFENKTISLVADIITVTLILMSAAYVLCIKGKLNLIPSFISPANYIPSAAISAALIFMIYRFAVSFLKSNEPITKGFSFALLILALLSIIHFILNSIYIRTVSARRATFGIFTVLFLCAYVIYLYLDHSMPINSPVRIADEMAYLSASIFFLYEVRLSLGREKWKCYALFGYVAALLCAYSSIPALITYFVNKKTISDSIYESILTFALFIFISFKLVLMENLTKNQEAPIITALKKYAEARESEIYPTQEENDDPTTTKVQEVEPEIDEPDVNQISIFGPETEEPAENASLKDENHDIQENETENSSKEDDQ